MQLNNFFLCVGFLVALVVNAPLNAQAVKDQDYSLHRSPSPFEIARLLNQSRAKKPQSAGDIELTALWKQLRIDKGSFGSCEGDCSARIFRHELDGRTGAEVVLKVTAPFQLCRYLVFSRTQRGWQLLGYVDHDFNKYEMSRHRVVRANKKSWLVIRGQEGSGSGFALYGETWYQTSAAGLRPVLSYPVQGHTYPWPSGLAREFQARPLPTSPANPSANEIVLQYSVSYLPSVYRVNEIPKLFANQHSAHYVWDQGSSTFVFDAVRSDISEREIEAIANIQSDDEPEPATKIGNTAFYSIQETKAFVGGGYEVFLKYNSGALMKIATGRNPKAKEWLQHFLNECADTPEKVGLLKALQTKQN